MLKIHPRNTLLVDADGVLLDWELEFSVWMARLGFKRIADTEKEYKIGPRYGISDDQSRRLIQMFNESARVGFMQPFRDALFYVKKLNQEHGFNFHCITSLSDEPAAMALRELNLRQLFGAKVFTKIVCLPTGADKQGALSAYTGTGCYWIEDKPENAEVGKSLGLRPMLMSHQHNEYYKNPGIPRVQNWREIYELLIK